MFPLLIITISQPSLERAVAQDSNRYFSRRSLHNNNSISNRENHSSISIKSPKAEEALRAMLIIQIIIEQVILSIKTLITAAITEAAEVDNTNNVVAISRRTCNNSSSNRTMSPVASLLE